MTPPDSRRPEPEALTPFFARVSADPLAHAFAGRTPPHARGPAAPVAPAEVGALWAELKSAPRLGASVAYVHVPFCENHCLFCGFYQHPWRAEAGPPYVDAVLAQAEADAQTPAQAAGPLRGLYLGGGTPTALAARDIARLVDGLRRRLPLAPDCEITLEGRIHGFDDEKAAAAFDAGVNRISLGVQSFDETVRLRLGRRTDRAGLLRRLDALVAADLGSIVIDLIYGLPGQSRETFRNDVRMSAALGLDGVDLYALKAIPGTPLLVAAEKGKLSPAAPETLGQYYADGAEEMDRAGWEPISTAHWRCGTRERSLYNMAVKSGAHCLAFGAGAGGSLHGHGYRLTADLEAFVAGAAQGAGGLVAGLTRPSPRAAAHNALKAGMERGWLDPAGVARALAADGAPDDFEAFIDPLLRQWAMAGLVHPHAGAWRLTLAGRFWQVAMTARLIAATDLHASQQNRETP